MRIIAIVVLLLLSFAGPVWAQEQDPLLLPSRDVPSVVSFLPMPGQQSMSEQGIAFLKFLEDFRPTAYRDSGGGHSIGYGFQTWQGRRVTPSYPRRVDVAQADQELRRQLAMYEAIVRAEFNGNLPQPAFDAMTSVCFNLGRVNSSILNAARTGRPVTVQHFVTTAKAANRFSPLVYSRRVREFMVFLGDYEAAMDTQMGSWAKITAAYRSLLSRSARLSIIEM